MTSPTLTRRALLAGVGTAVASAAIAVPHVNAAHAENSATLSIAERIEHHIAGLREALADMQDEGIGPVRAIVGSDHGAIIQPLAGHPFDARVPPALWRCEKPARTA